MRTSRNRCPRQYSTTPMLMYSPRSTRGTNRMTAYSNTCMLGILCGSYKYGRLGHARRQKLDVHRPDRLGIFALVRMRDPFIGNLADDRLYPLGSQRLLSQPVGLFQFGRPAQEHMVLDLHERLAGLRS